MINREILDIIYGGLQAARPYKADGSEEIDTARTLANNDLLELAYEHLPALLDEIEKSKQAPRRMVKFEVSSKLIRDALALPDDAKICAISKSSQDPDVYVVFVEHPNFKELAEGAPPPQVKAIFKTDEEKRPSTWITMAWDELA